MKCANCQHGNACYQGKSCVDQGVRQKEYDNPENLKTLSVASRLEAEHYMKITRMEEVIRFAQEMGYTTIGIAFCVGLTKEAKEISDIFSKHFEVHFVCCKICGVNKEEFNLPNVIPDRYEAACNPIGQAKHLNESHTELNLIVGLCIGHDLLFTKYSQAPVSTLVVKDRVLAHNPLGAIYSNYWRKKL